MIAPIAPIVRFAPSPAGLLHVCNIRAALFNWLFAKRHGGSFVLRLDDTDRLRSKREFEVAIEGDLRCWGLTGRRGAPSALALQAVRGAGAVG